MRELILAAPREKRHKFKKLKLHKITVNSHSQVGSLDFVCYKNATKDPCAQDVELGESRAKQ